MVVRRTSFLLLLALLCVATVAGPVVGATGQTSGFTAPASSTVQADWIERGFDPANTSFNRFETVIGLSNISGLSVDWTGAIGDVNGASPAVANNVAYIGSQDGYLYTFDAAGVTNCSAAPRSCQPLWTAKTGRIDGTPAIKNGVLYIGANGKLSAFDAAGVTNCSGTPKTCSPLWTSDLRGISTSSPVVVNGVVYIGGGNAPAKLYVFDAAGVRNCSGTPKICVPLWIGDATGKNILFSSPAVANGVVYIGSQTNHGGGFDAFDAAGVKNCSGGICDPLWTANTGSVYDATPTVANGEVFIRSSNFTLFAFDAAGVVHCRGVPKTCKALWTSATRDVLTSAAVANGVLYIGSSDGLDAYDEAGVTNCTGRPSPRRCAPLWTGQAGGPALSDPAVANGVVYVGTPVGAIYAFDADGVVNCFVEVCDPVWTGATDGTYVESPIVVNGKVYAAATDGKLYAFGLS